MLCQVILLNININGGKLVRYALSHRDNYFMKARKQNVSNFILLQIRKSYHIHKRTRQTGHNIVCTHLLGE